MADPGGCLTLPRLGTINLHPAPLPRYRGPFPIEWAFRNDDPELGFTVHRMAGAFDTGAILAQGHVPIHDDDEPGDVLGRLPPLMQALLGHAIERVIRGEPGDEQDDNQASYAGPFEPAWRIVDWSQPARTIHNQVRSWTGIRDMPLGAIGAIDGEQVNVIRTRLIVGDGDSPASGSAGTVLRRDGDQLVVQCGDAPLELLNWTRVADTPA